MCICVCICANNMQILGFGGVGGLGVGGGIPLGGGVGVRGPGSYIRIKIYSVELHFPFGSSHTSWVHRVQSWVKSLVPQ